MPVSYLRAACHKFAIPPPQNPIPIMQAPVWTPEGFQAFPKPIQEAPKASFDPKPNVLEL